MMLIEMGKKYQTRDGRAVLILCVDAELKQPVVGAVAGKTSPDSWCIDGTYDKYQSSPNIWDLVEAPIPPALVPLGPEDVLANFSLLDFGSSKCGVVTVHPDGVTFVSGGVDGCLEFMTWRQLKNSDVQYSKHNNGTFAPCSKPA